jgi:hypothetical protein
MSSSDEAILKNLEETAVTQIAFEELQAQGVDVNLSFRHGNMFTPIVGKPKRKDRLGKLNFIGFKYAHSQRV